MGDDTKPAATPAAAIPDIAPFLLPSVEEKFTSDAAKADAATAKAEQEASKTKKAAAEIRLKAYKDKLAEITKTGDFDKAQQVNARITQLENDPEGESHKPEKPSKRPRPKDTVKFGGHSYVLIKEPATWHVAKLRCEEMGGHLVCINNRNEEEFVERLCATNNAWIGATDEDVEGHWFNVDKTAVSLNKTDIDNGSGLEHWLYWNGKLFQDFPSGARINYVCEWDR